MQQHRHRQNKQRQIRRHIKTRIKQPHTRETKTMPLHGIVPEPLHGHAVQEAADDGPDPERDYQAYDEVAGESEAAVGEDAEVLE